MKKCTSIVLSLLLAAGLAACGQKSALQKATGANAEQNQTIVQALEQAGVFYETITALEDGLSETDVPGGCTVYELTGRNAARYYLVLDGEYRVVMILDESETPLTGGNTLP